MTLDSLIAILGLVIAVYQIMPRARQLDLALRVQPSDWFLIVLALAAIFYLQFYSFFTAIGLSPHFGFSKLNLTPERVSFVVIVVTAAIVGLHLHVAKLSVSRMPGYKRLVDELITTKNFSALIALVERHVDQLVKIVRDELPTSRLRQYLVPPDELTILFQELSAPQAEGRPVQLHLNRLKARRLLRPLVKLLPDRSKESLAAKELAQNLLTSKEFAFSLARTRPYLALKLLSLDRHQVGDFLRNFVRALLIEPATVLQYELLDLPIKDDWYLIDPSKRLLHFFFADAKVAEEYAVWSPLGETVIAELDRLARDPEDPYNLPPDRDFQDNEQWQSSLFVAVLLFDVMVRQALRQSIQWHMWLYYFSHFTGRIVRNYSLDGALVEPELDLPTRYSELLYNMFSTIRDWIELVKRVPKDQPNVVLRSTAPDHENGNIPKSAIVCLGFCLKDVLPAEKISQRLKRNILHRFFNLYFDLRANDRGNYAEALALAMRPPRSPLPEENARYSAALAEAFDSFDKFPHPREQMDELRVTLEIP